MKEFYLWLLSFMWNAAIKSFSHPALMRNAIKSSVWRRALEMSLLRHWKSLPMLLAENWMGTCPLCRGWWRQPALASSVWFARTASAISIGIERCCLFPRYETYQEITHWGLNCGVNFQTHFGTSDGHWINQFAHEWHFNLLSIRVVAILIHTDTISTHSVLK
jgi:hypothetical protein